MSKILLTTYGSYGDLYPFIAMGKALIEFGHQVTLVTHFEYQEIVERFGIQFIGMKPSEKDFGSEEIWLAKVHDPDKGSNYLINDIILPYLEESYKLLELEIIKYDLVISHFLTFAAPLVAEKYKVPWLSCILQPSIFMSAYDIPALGYLKYIPKFKFLSPIYLKVLYPFIFNSINKYLKPVAQLRLKIGLPSANKNLLFGGSSPNGTLALFPKAFAPEQPDWPKDTQQIGFPLFDQEESAEISQGTRKFIDAGEPPIVFTLGSTIVRISSNFYEMAYLAVKGLGCRAIFLVGKKPLRIPEAALHDPKIYISAYEPFSALFPSCSAVVHQCGIGTIGQALAAGLPQVLIPYSHDQPDNARRAEKLGIGLTIQARSLSKLNLTKALKKVMKNSSFSNRASQLSGEFKNKEFNLRLVKAVNRYLNY